MVLTGDRVRQDYSEPMRRVTARIEIAGAERVMVFLTDNPAWAASSVADLHGCRWRIETFLKELKQTVPLVDSLGHSANAVKWQVGTALPGHLLLLFLAWQSRWTHGFSRLVTSMRAARWLDRNIYALRKRGGTAHGDFRCLGSPEQAWLPGFARNTMGQPV